jgi:hypothetical protein
VAFVRGFLRFWYDFVVGDDWRIAGAALVATDAVSDAVLVPLVGAAIVAVVSVSIVAGARRQRARSGRNTTNSTRSTSTSETTSRL